jgi:hypothetical protein
MSSKTNASDIGEEGIGSYWEEQWSRRMQPLSVNAADSLFDPFAMMLDDQYVFEPRPIESMLLQSWCFRSREFSFIFLPTNSQNGKIL